MANTGRGTEEAVLKVLLVLGPSTGPDTRAVVPMASSARSSVNVIVNVISQSRQNLIRKGSKLPRYNTDEISSNYSNGLRQIKNID